MRLADLAPQSERTVYDATDGQTDFSEEFFAAAMSNAEGGESEAAASLPPEIAGVITMFGQDSVEGFGPWLGGLSPGDADAVVATLQMFFSGGQP